MFVAKQSRTYPTEYMVSSPDSDDFISFHGKDVQARAEEYAAFLNSERVIASQDEAAEKMPDTSVSALAVVDASAPKDEQHES